MSKDKNKTISWEIIFYCEHNEDCKFREPGEKKSVGSGFHFCKHSEECSDYFGGTLCHCPAAQIEAITEGTVGLLKK